MFYIFFQLQMALEVFTVWKVCGFREFLIPTIYIYAALNRVRRNSEPVFLDRLWGEPIPGIE
jgi:hypothetical protein